MSKHGYLVISLDFELLWGVFDVVDIDQKRSCFQKTRQIIIPGILNLFEAHQIRATWATVGMLFNKNWNDWSENIPVNLPKYFNTRLSAYNFVEETRDKDSIEDFCFAPGLIKQIHEIPGQEIGTHTYSHYYCQEPGQNVAQFRSDLEKAVELAAEMDIRLKSLVFPRNQLSTEYLSCCTEMGITNVRSNPSSWYWKDARSANVITRLARSGDAYVPLNKKSYGLINLRKEPGLPLEQKASRFLRPVEDNAFLRKLKMKRIKMEMTSAARNGEIYHLWWHPHNFGRHPEESLKDLAEIISHFKILQKKYGFQSENMEGLYQVLLKNI